MKPVGFEWDDQKAEANLRKHGVSFEEAATVFDDPLGRIFPDQEHSEGEVRDIIVGHSSRDILLLVSFTERGELVRIINARPVTRFERNDYEKRDA